jgi:hypothetical protein
MASLHRRAAHMLCCTAGEMAALRKLVCGDPLGALDSARTETHEALNLMEGSTTANGFERLEKVSQGAVASNSERPAAAVRQHIV